MSEPKYIRHFFPTPKNNDPLPPIRDANGNYVGGELRAECDHAAEDLARLLHNSMRHVTIADAVRYMPMAYDAALEIVLKRLGYTQEFTADEKERLKQQAEQKARNEKVHEEARKRGEAIREAARVDRYTRDQLADFKPRSPSTQKGSPAYAIERARFAMELNETRAKHGLQPLTA